MLCHFIATKLHTCYPKKELSFNIWFYYLQYSDKEILTCLLSKLQQLYFSNTSLKYVMFDIGADARRLEPCTISWDGKNKPLGCPIFCCANDLWKLCLVQLTSGHFSWRVFQSGRPCLQNNRKIVKDENKSCLVSSPCVQTYSVIMILVWKTSVLP